MFHVTFISDLEGSVLPTDPLDLSYWVTQCLPIDRENRVKLLSFDSALERLQYALTLIDKVNSLFLS